MQSLKKITRLIRSSLIKTISRQPYLLHLDQPPQQITQPYLALRGWIVTNNKNPIGNISVHEDNNGIDHMLIQEERTDVGRTFPFQNSTGFFGPVIPIATENESIKIQIDFTFGDSSYKHRLELPIASSVSLFFDKKKSKLQRIKPILICPECTSDELDFANDNVACKKCGGSYLSNKHNFDFLPADSQKYTSHENISEHDYYNIQQELLRDNSHGLVLDCGCGLKQNYHPNVVYCDIADYPTTDVRGTAEKLPFKDNAFDAVISIALLEHVKNPFKCASEILRVLRPGGILHIDVPFLQPFHGYPDHYYNITQSGLLNLFGDKIEIQTCAPSNHPLDLLPWYINSYIKELSDHDKNKFLNTRLRRFLDDKNHLNQTFATNLPKKTRQELAYSFQLRAKKR